MILTAAALLEIFGILSILRMDRARKPVLEHPSGLIYAHVSSKQRHQGDYCLEVGSAGEMTSSMSSWPWNALILSFYLSYPCVLAN